MRDIPFAWHVLKSITLIHHRMLRNLYPRLIFAPATGSSRNYTELSSEDLTIEP